MSTKEAGTYYATTLSEDSSSNDEIPHTNIKPWISGKHIIIAGAGMSGLSFGMALTQLFKTSPHPPPTITIYERDSRTDRVGREGYTLSLRSDAGSGGIQILDKLGLYEKGRDVSVAHAGSMNFWKNNFDTPLLQIKVAPVGPKGLLPMRIRRNGLQKVLADNAEQQGCKIQWETAVLSAERLSATSESTSEKMLVYLSDASTATCDLLIAADGARSKVLQSLNPSATLTYAGLNILAGTSRFSSPNDVPTPLNTDWGLILGGGGTGLFVSPVDAHSALWSFSYRSTEPCDSLRHPISSSQTNELLGEALSLALNFSDPKIRHLVEATSPTTLMKFPAMHRLPFTHAHILSPSQSTFPSSPSSPSPTPPPVIFLGDANHAVTPFAGNGANMAIMDGWDLGVSLISHETLHDAVQAYDGKSIPRATATLKTSMWVMDAAHARGWKLWGYEWLIWIVRMVLGGKGKGKGKGR